MNFPLSLPFGIKAVWIINAGDLWDLNEPWDSFLISLCELCLSYSHASTLVQEIMYVGAGPRQMMDFYLEL